MKRIHWLDQVTNYILRQQQQIMICIVFWATSTMWTEREIAQDPRKGQVGLDLSWCSLQEPIAWITSLLPQAHLCACGQYNNFTLP